MCGLPLYGAQGRRPPYLLSNDRQNVVFAEDENVLAVALDLAARVLADEDRVSGLDVEGALGPVLEDLPVSDGHDLAALGLLLGGVRDDDPALGGGALLDAVDQQAVVQGAYVHRGPLFRAGCLLRKKGATRNSQRGHVSWPGTGSGFRNLEGGAALGAPAAIGPRLAPPWRSRLVAGPG